MENLYYETKGQLEQVHFALGKLERSADEREAQVISQEIQAKLGQIDTKCDQLNIFVNKEPPNRRHLARQKVDQLKNDSQSVNLAISAMYARLTAKWRAASDREELLKQRFRPNDNTALSMDDQEFMMNDRLQNSNREVDNMIGHGLAVLDNLRTQHVSLRGVKRKMLDIGSALGLSSTTLSMIDRRVREDWFIFLVGCIFVLIFMYVFYRFWKGW